MGEEGAAVVGQPAGVPQVHGGASFEQGEGILDEGDKLSGLQGSETRGGEDGRVRAVFVWTADVSSDYTLYFLPCNKQ